MPAWCTKAVISLDSEGNLMKSGNKNSAIHNSSNTAGNNRFQISVLKTWGVEGASFGFEVLKNELPTGPGKATYSARKYIIQ